MLASDLGFYAKSSGFQLLLLPRPRTGSYLHTPPPRRLSLGKKLSDIRMMPNRRILYVVLTECVRPRDSSG